MNYDTRYPIKTIGSSQFPNLLNHINDPPKELFIRGTLPSYHKKFLCVVGSRAHTDYGKDACEKLISGLRGYDVVIVSGLALGIDTIAHTTALDAGLTTIALPGSGLGFDVLYPAENRKLAEHILDASGALISEEKPGFKPYPFSFPKRNRIMAGMSHAVLVVEARLKSGTLITSKYATDYNRDVLAVPGSIFSKRSEGPHMLIRLGATPVRTSTDILEALGFKTDKETKTQKQRIDCTPEEKALLKLLDHPMTRDEIIRTSGHPAAETNAILVMLEIKGLVTEREGMLHPI